jgi:ribonuclease E
LADLKLPKSMGLIVRTAGLSAPSRDQARLRLSRPPVGRDPRKDARQPAPALIHSDSDLIKRAIRDIYNKRDRGSRGRGRGRLQVGQGFMKLLMPSHAGG